MKQVTATDGYEKAIGEMNLEESCNQNVAQKNIFLKQRINLVSNIYPIGRYG